MNRRFGFLGILAAAVLMMSCNNGIKEYGSVNLDTSAIARHIVQVNADYTSQQEGQPFGNESDFKFTEEETQKLAQLLMTEVYLDVQLNTSGSVQKKEQKKITYMEMLQMSAGSTDAHGNLYSEDLQLEIKNIPVGSTIDLEASVAMICTDKYKDGVKAIYEAALKRSFGTDDQGKLPEYAQYILDMAIQSLVMGVGGNQKYEGKTDQPITIKAGKNSATIQMYQTDGFIAGGSFDIELEDNKPLELVVMDSSNGYILTCKDNTSAIIKVQFVSGSDDQITDIPSGNSGVPVGTGNNFNICFTNTDYISSVSINMKGGYNGTINELFEDNSYILIIAKNKETGSYKTAVFTGL